MRSTPVQLAIIVLCAGGCARTLYYHPTPSLNTVEQFEKDKYECVQQATAWAHNFGATGNPFIIADQTNACLEKLKGWRKLKK